MSAPYAALFCQAGHRYRDFVCSYKEQPETFPKCPCGLPQVGFTYHYGGIPLGDPNECRGEKTQLTLLGKSYFVRHKWTTWFDAGLGRRVRRRVLSSFLLEVWDITPLIAEQRELEHNRLRAVS